MTVCCHFLNFLLQRSDHWPVEISITLRNPNRFVQFPAAAKFYHLETSVLKGYKIVCKMQKGTIYTHNLRPMPSFIKFLLENKISAFFQMRTVFSNPVSIAYILLMGYLHNFDQRNVHQIIFLHVATKLW